MPTSISNPRDLVAELLGQLLYVERRLHDAILPAIAGNVRDEELLADLRLHQQQTSAHVDRVEQAFAVVGLHATSNRASAVEGSVDQYERLVKNLSDGPLADLFHAQAALHGEHWEMAAYRTLLPLLPPDAVRLLRPSFDEEGAAARRFVEAIDRLAR